jgi:hypothetical protein
MKLMRWFECGVKAIGAAVAVVRFMVILLVELAALVVVAAAVVAYLKREQWTKPAYRWVRDQSGRWNVTPWAPAGPGAAERGES